MDDREWEIVDAKTGYRVTLPKLPGGAGLVRAVKAAVAPPVVRWTSDIAFEGEATGDGRYMMPRAITWRDLPIPLMAMTETGHGGHQGAFLAGKIERIHRDRRFDMNGDPLPDGVVAIRAEGVFDMEGDNGAEVARLVGDEFVRGVSIDPGMVEAMIRDPETGETWTPREAPDEIIDRAIFGEMQTAYARYEIAGATVCPTPAFANARIAIIASGAEPSLLAWFRIVPEAVTAGAAGLAPLKPPRDWFETPEADGPRPLTVSNDGRVTGHIAVWDSCHTGKQGVCFQPPSSPSGYAYFNLGEVLCADGSRVACGQITLDTDHAPLSATGRGAKAHYEHTGAVGADVRAVDGRFGIWVAGAVRPGVTEEQARALMAAKPSGDWRSMTPGGPLELIGILAVNVPGFPVPRPEVRLVASAEQPGGETVALVAAGFGVETDGFDRRLRVLAARAEGGIDGLAELAGV